MRRWGWVFGLGFMAMALLACFGGSALVWLITSNGAGFEGSGPPLGFFFSRVFSGLAFVVGVLGFVFLLRTLRSTLRPLSDLMDAAARVERGDFTARVPVRGPRDVRALIRSFNAMAERLQANEDTRRNLLADVTHELRTPLTIIQGNLEGVLDGVYPRDDAHFAPILEETRVMSRLIEDLRTLSLAESGALTLQREPTDLATLARDAAAAFAAQADAAGVTLTVDAPNAVVADVDEMRIRAVLNNLIANALRYTPGGGSVTLSAARDGDTAHVEVRDTGQGIAPDVLPHIFDRFYKGRDSAGTGLGLAIAKQIVELHGGEISAESEIGSGTRIGFSVPAYI
jgi:two-component system OmpR family sensor kinase/two-component system sensor histidine kinase BaeS